MGVSHISKSHNISLFMYHLARPAKCRRVVFSKEVEMTLKETCEGISDRYEINFIGVVSDEDHVCFLVHSVPLTHRKRLFKQ